MISLSLSLSSLLISFVSSDEFSKVKSRILHERICFKRDDILNDVIGLQHYLLMPRYGG
jgi:hypothetical protein